jgi:myo-inositol 2-dehydrogenase/D-chiro-inositol 1-dehydrogenase
MAAREITPSFVERFRDAYDIEVQHWVDAAKRGEVGGPTVWDGYATAACCEAGVTAQQSGEKVEGSLKTKPGIYHQSFSAVSGGLPDWH